MSGRSPSVPYRVLFLCTGNSARSILAEALLEALGSPRFRGFSAGSHPKTAPHPVALEVLAEHGLPTANLRSKGWDEFARDDGVAIDLVVTVCDRAAKENCPIWPGAPATTHWSHVDPAAVTGSPAETRAAFESVYGDLKAEIIALVDADPAHLEPKALRSLLERIGGVSPARD